MTYTFNGSNNNIQRKVRRAFDHLKNNPNKQLVPISDSYLVEILKSIFIAIDEDLANYNHLYNALPSDPDGAILIDTSTVSTLDPAPFDMDA